MGRTPTSAQQSRDERRQGSRQPPVEPPPALEGGVVAPLPPSGMPISSAPTASVRRPPPSNRFATAGTAAATALQPPVTAVAAALENFLQASLPAGAGSSPTVVDIWCPTPRMTMAPAMALPPPPPRQTLRQCPRSPRPRARNAPNDSRSLVGIACLRAPWAYHRPRAARGGHPREDLRRRCPAF